MHTHSARHAQREQSLFHVCRRTLGQVCVAAPGETNKTCAAAGGGCQGRGGTPSRRPLRWRKGHGGGRRAGGHLGRRATSLEDKGRGGGGCIGRGATTTTGGGPLRWRKKGAGEIAMGGGPPRRGGHLVGKKKGAGGGGVAKDGGPPRAGGHPKLAQSWPNLSEVCPMLVGAGPSLVASGPILAEVGRGRAKIIETAVPTRTQIEQHCGVTLRKLTESDPQTRNASTRCRREPPRPLRRQRRGRASGHLRRRCRRRRRSRRHRAGDGVLLRARARARATARHERLRMLLEAAEL